MNLFKLSLKIIHIIFFFNTFFYTYTMHHRENIIDEKIRLISNITYPLLNTTLKSLPLFLISHGLKTLNKKKQWIKNKKFDTYLNIASSSILATFILKNIKWVFDRNLAYKKRLDLFTKNNFKDLTLTYLGLNFNKNYTNSLILPGTLIVNPLKTMLKNINIETDPVFKIPVFKWSQNVGDNYFKNDGTILANELSKKINLNTAPLFIMAHSNGGNVIFHALKNLANKQDEKIKTYLNSVSIYLMCTPISKKTALEIIEILKKNKIKLRIFSLEKDAIQDSDIVGHTNFSLLNMIIPNPNSPVLTRDTTLVEELEKLDKSVQNNIDFCQIYLKVPYTINHINTFELIGTTINQKPFFEYIEELIIKEKNKSLFLNLQY